MKNSAHKIGKRIFIGGGAGYIGSFLVPELLQRGYDVTVTDLLWFGNHLPPGIPVIQKDLLLCSREDFFGFDQVILLAGLSNDPMAEFQPRANFLYNAAMPAWLAYEAKKAGVKRFIYASSCSVYGNTPGHISTERSTPTSTYPYGASKLQGERGILQFCGDHFSVIALRQGTVCGFSPRMRMDLAVNAMFKSAFAEGKIFVHNEFLWRPILAIEDAAQAYVQALEADISIHGIFNVASGNYTVGDIGRTAQSRMEELLHRKVDVEIQSLQDDRNYRVSTKKAERHLHFSPNGTVKSIVDDLFYHRSFFGDLNNPAYINIESFRELTLHIAPIRAVRAQESSYCS